ncbi:hypothetical protein Tco_0000193 [Tanacetum coccineum]
MESQRHMTGKKDHLDDFEECKGGSVTFGGSKGYITSKGRIKVADEDEELIVVPTAIKHSTAKVGPRKSSTNSKEEKDTPENLAYRRDLDSTCSKALKEDNYYLTKLPSNNSVNSGKQGSDSIESKLISKGEGIDNYDMFLLPVARIKAINEEVYVSQPPGFVDPDHPKKVYKISMSSMGELIILPWIARSSKDGGIFISQDNSCRRQAEKFDVARFTDSQRLHNLMREENLKKSTTSGCSILEAINFMQCKKQTISVLPLQQKLNM